MDKKKGELFDILTEVHGISNKEAKCIIDKSLSDWISTNFVPKEEVEKERNRTRRAFCEVCKVFIDADTGKRSS